MICPKCGETLSDDAQFCGSCGAKIEAAAAAEQTPVQEQPVQPVQPAQPVQEQPAPAANANTINAADIANKAKAVGGEALNKANAVADSATAAVKKVVPGATKKIIIIAAAALVVVIVACFIIFGNLISKAGSTSYQSIPHSVYLTNNGGELALFIDGKAISNDATYQSGSYTFAQNGNAIVYNGVLYKIDGTKLVEVNDSVTGAKVSKNSNAILYISDNAMYIYKDGKENLVFDEFEKSASTVTAVLSPNGNTVVFVDKADDIVTYIYKGSKAEKLGKNIHPLSVSDDASVLYALKYDVSESGTATKGNVLYLVKNGKVDDLIKVKGEVTSIKYSSNDAKKILFVSTMGTYYYAPNLKETIKVDSNSISTIVPTNCLNKFDDFKSFIGIDGASVKKFTLKGDSFEKYTIASAITSYKLSADGKTLLYKRNNNLYSISTTSDNAEAVKLAEDVGVFGASADLTKIYAINTDNELVFSNGKSEKTTKICDDAQNICVSSNGVCCYEVDDVLYTTSGGSKGSKVEKMSDVTSISVSNGKYFYVLNDGVLYVSSDGKSFTKTSVEK